MFLIWLVSSGGLALSSRSETLQVLILPESVAMGLLHASGILICVRGAFCATNISCLRHSGKRKIAERCNICSNLIQQYYLNPGGM